MLSTGLSMLSTGVSMLSTGVTCGGQQWSLVIKVWVGDTHDICGDFRSRSIQPHASAWPN